MSSGARIPWDRIHSGFWAAHERGVAAGLRVAARAYGDAMTNDTAAIPEPTEPTVEVPVETTAKETTSVEVDPALVGAQADRTTETDPGTFGV